MQKLNLTWGIYLLVFSLLFILIGIYFSAAGSTTKITELIPNNNSNDGNFVIHVETTDDRSTIPIDYTIRETDGEEYDNPQNTTSSNDISNSEQKEENGNTNNNSNSNSGSNNNVGNENNGYGQSSNSNNNSESGRTESNPTPNNNNTSQSSNNNPTPNNSNNTNTQNNNQENNNPSPEISEIAITPQRVASFKNSIENKFYITIKYEFEEVKNYAIQDYTVVPMEDLNAIYTSLEKLQNSLSLYPNGFFKEMKDGGLPLTVYLIKRFNSINTTGISSKSNGLAVICIATDYPFESTFHHENFHYMEYYMNTKGGKFSNWNNYNPSNFMYGNQDHTLVYEFTNSPYSYFVNSYAQSDPLEDRGCTFEYMMASNKISPLNQNNNIWKKAMTISSMIDYYYKTVNSNTIEYWERFL